MTIIDFEHLEKICKPGTTECCAYLIVGHEGFECAKDTELQATIKLRLVEGTMNVTEENCAGYDLTQKVEEALYPLGRV